MYVTTVPSPAIDDVQGAADLFAVPFSPAYRGLRTILGRMNDLAVEIGGWLDVHRPRCKCRLCRNDAACRASIGPGVAKEMWATLQHFLWLLEMTGGQIATATSDCWWEEDEDLTHAVRSRLLEMGLTPDGPDPAVCRCHNGGGNR